MFKSKKQQAGKFAVKCDKKKSKRKKKMMMILVQIKRKGNFEYVNVEFTHTYNYPTHMVADNKCLQFSCNGCT